MFWWILEVVSLVCLLVGIIWYIIDEYSFAGVSMMIVGGIAFVVLAIMIPVATISCNQQVEVFKQQKEYIETHISENDIEDAALTSKKIELNTWLLNNQYTKKNYGYFVLYKDEILELTPID